MKTLKNTLSYLLIALTFLVSSCSEDEVVPKVLPGSAGFFIVNEGAFGNGNASLSYFDKSTNSITNDIFLSNTGKPLGDQAQSMTIFNDKGYIVVQNSAKIEVIDLTDISSIVTIDANDGIASPRYFIGINDSKGYISDWGADGVSGTVKVLDLTTNEITKTIEIGQGTNKMLLLNSKVYVTNSGGWGQDNTVKVIDINTDEVVKTITTGNNPKDIVADENGDIWVLGSGAIAYNSDWSVNIESSTAGFISKIENDEVTASFAVSDKSSSPNSLIINNSGTSLFFNYNGGVYELKTTDINSSSVSINEVISKNFYGLAFDPSDENILGSESPDFTSSGTVYRYNVSGQLIDKYSVGIAPNGFVFN